MSATNLWHIEESGFSRENVELHGSKFLLGNGRFGCRGTLEEFGREQLVGCLVAGLYDRSGSPFKEPVNAPNPFFTRLNTADGVALNPLTLAPAAHTQRLDLRRAVHERRTVFRLADGNEITVRAERFLSAADRHVFVLRYAFTCTRACALALETGIDGEVWDMNGPHLGDFAGSSADGLDTLAARTHEARRVVAVTTMTAHAFPDGEPVLAGRLFSRRFMVSAAAGVEYTITKYAAIASEPDTADPAEKSRALCAAAARKGFDALLAEHAACWAADWARCDVAIEGDPEAQRAMRYSLYHLLAIAPKDSEKTSIPARGFSGQVYKGGVFWDTELFMQPFFQHTFPEVARNLVKYRCHTLDGARRKARGLGYRGAYFAWESQDTGDEACLPFNQTDVFTGRPVRTYFADKQIHVTADVALGLWEYFAATGDDRILLEGGAETILECARFFVSFAYFKKDKNRYELLDVTGPDEYHERVNNNAYTNRMARHTLDLALKALALLRERHPRVAEELTARLNFGADLAAIEEVRDLLYVPAPDPKTNIIEQFDGLHKLEDISLETLKKRVLNPNEFLGGIGPAVHTQIAKQADVVMMLHVFRAAYSREVKEANWRHYEPRCENGSSLSYCAYALVALELGDVEYAYKYFLKTATIDLTGNYRRYVGIKYIGGTHPAANGGAWMVAISGFAGVTCADGVISIRPRLPANWQALAFPLEYRRGRFTIRIAAGSIAVTADASNPAVAPLLLGSVSASCRPGETVNHPYQS